MTVSSLLPQFGTAYDMLLRRAADEIDPRSRAQRIDPPPADWAGWLRAMFPAYVGFEFGDHHAAFWDHVWSLKRGQRPPAFIAIWPRGGGKSSSAEMATVALGARGVRKYAWYVRETQELADKSVGNIAVLLESSAIAEFYPMLGAPQKGKYGNTRGWRRERMRAASGFTVDAIGFDTAYRGSKVEENRPDLICHEVGTPVYDMGRWVMVEEHPGRLGLRQAEGLEVQVAGLSFAEVVTPEHRYWARKNVADDGGWIEARDLEPGDQIGYGLLNGAFWNRVRSVQPAGVRTFAPITTASHTYLTAFGLSHNCLDDLDNKLDNPGQTAKKITTLTTSLLPAGSPDVAVIGIQNLIIPNGLFSRMADGRADFLRERIVSGPHPAVRNLTYEMRGGRYVITGGQSIWVGQNLEHAQQQLDAWGLTAFLHEAQHDVEEAAGGMFDHLEFMRCSWDELPALVRIVVWVDPAVTSTDASDSQGIQADGIGPDGTIFRLFSWEHVTSPQDALQRAIRKAVELGAEAVGVETDQGGDTWASVYREAAAGLGISDPPPFRSDKAGAGHGPKAHRAQQMLADYERGRIIHVLGTHVTLEKALRRFPKVKPFDLTDAAYWSWQDLRGPVGGVGFVL